MSMMDLFVLVADKDDFLREITKEQYQRNLNDAEFDYGTNKKRMYELSVWDELKFFKNPPHPLKQVIFLQEYVNNTPTSTSGYYAFQFKHKGKYYLWEDYWG